MFSCCYSNMHVCWISCSLLSSILPSNMQYIKADPQCQPRQYLRRPSLDVLSRPVASELWNQLRVMHNVCNQHDGYVLPVADPDVVVEGMTRVRRRSPH